MAVHKCNKEREIGILMADITNLKDNQKEMKEGQHRIEDKLDKFIGSADKKYATKEEVKSLQEENKRQDKEIKWTREKTIGVIKDVAMTLGMAILGTKTVGVW